MPRCASSWWVVEPTSNFPNPPSSQLGCDSTYIPRAVTKLASSGKIVLSDVEPHVATWHSDFVKDPWAIPLERKIDHLLQATEPMRSDPRIHQASGDISSYRQEKIFASTVGSYIEQT